MANKGEMLEELFNIFTEQLLLEVKTAKEEGLPIPAADKAAIIRFLQINNMAYQPGDNEGLKALQEQLRERQEKNNGSALAALRASEKDIDDLIGLYPDKMRVQ